LDIGVLGYIGIVQHKEHSPEVSHIPPGTSCIFISVSDFPYEDYLKVNPHIIGLCLLSDFYGPELNFREEF